LIVLLLPVSANIIPAKRSFGKQRRLTLAQRYITQHISESTDRNSGKYINDRVLFQENGRQTDEYGRNEKSNMPAYVFFAF